MKAEVIKSLHQSGIKPCLSKYYFALDRIVETLGRWIIIFLVTFIKRLNQSSIKPSLIVHLVAVWTVNIKFNYLCVIFVFKIIRLPRLNNSYLNEPFFHLKRLSKSIYFIQKAMVKAKAKTTFSTHGVKAAHAQRHDWGQDWGSVRCGPPPSTVQL